MTSVVVPLAAGCEELEAVTIVDLLRRANITVITASLTPDLQITASRQVKLVADAVLEELDPAVFDLIVLPGGQPGTANLSQDPHIHTWLTQFHAAEKYIAAICAAPLVLAEAGLLNQRKATSYPGVLTSEQWPDIDLQSDAVVIDGHLITSRGPGTAIDFALTLIELLTDNATRQQVEQDLVRTPR